MTLAPVAVFAFNRPEHLSRTLEGLNANPEASRTDLHIFCDEARNGDEEARVREVRAIARAARGFKSVDVIEAHTNLGLAQSIWQGVSQMCQRYGRAIVLEDDVVPTPYFLMYMNDALDLYADEERVASIGACTLTSRALPDTFFVQVPDCWGWGVWQRSWMRFDADARRLLRGIKAGGYSRRFDFGGAYPYTDMLADCAAGLNQSWAIRWYAHTFLQGHLTLYPGRAVTSNIGFEGSGTHGRLASQPDLCLAASPIQVQRLNIEECAEAHAAWAVALAQMAGSPGSGAIVKGKIKRMAARAKGFLC